MTFHETYVNETLGERREDTRERFDEGDFEFIGDFFVKKGL
jgi:hypothetical protein